MNTLLQAGARVQELLERKGWQFCFIGGVANFRWGTPRIAQRAEQIIGPFPRN